MNEAFDAMTWMAHPYHWQVVGWPSDVAQVTREQGSEFFATFCAPNNLEPEKMVVLAVGKASEVEAGDTDHPGALKDVAKLPLSRIPLRDPLTLNPLP